MADILGSNSGVSTWGCAINEGASNIAVSANSHNISVWNLEDFDLPSDAKVNEGHQHNIPCIGAAIV